MFESGVIDGDRQLVTVIYGGAETPFVGACKALLTADSVLIVLLDLFRQNFLRLFVRDIFDNEAVFTRLFTGE